MKCRHKCNSNNIVYWKEIKVDGKIIIKIYMRMRILALAFFKKTIKIIEIICNLLIIETT